MKIIKLNNQEGFGLLLECEKHAATSSHSASSTLESIIAAQLPSKIITITTGILHGDSIKPLQILYDSIKRCDTMSRNEFHLRLLKSEFFMMLLRRNNEWVESLDIDGSGIYITINDCNYEGEPIDRTVDLLDMPTSFQAIFKVGLELMATYDNLVVIEGIENLGMGDLEHFLQYLVCIVKNCHDSIYLSSTDANSIKQLNKGLADLLEIEAQ